MKRPAFFAMLSLTAAFASAATNDLVITSITRQNNCTTLNWRSHPGEFYTVYWTDAMSDRPYWRVAEVNVPSGGTNTTWYECEGGGQMMMMAGGGENGSAPTRPRLTPEERAARLEELRAKAKEMADYLMRMLQEAVERAAKLREERRSGRATTSANGSGSMNLMLGGNDTNATARFYRVARTAVAGTVDGLPDVPAGLTNFIAVAVGGSHYLALIGVHA